MSMTPRQLSYLIKRLDAEHTRQEFFVGIIASTIVNWSMCRGEDFEPVCPADYMPSQFGKKRKGPEDMDLGEARSIIGGAFGG
jgi:hypothetical protein